jgi:hypothetical protein
MPRLEFEELTAQEEIERCGQASLGGGKQNHGCGFLTFMNCSRCRALEGPRDGAVRDGAPSHDFAQKRMLPGRRGPAATRTRRGGGGGAI